MFQEKTREDLIRCALMSGIAVFAILAAFLVTRTVTEVIAWFDDDFAFENTISISGEGEETAVPDVASFSFSVIEIAGTTEAAQNLATAKNNEAVELLKNNGIDEKDIKTQGYNVYPQYNNRVICRGFDCPEPSAPEIIGYEVNQTISVKVRNTDDAGRILAELGRVGVSNISGLDFSIDDPSKYQNMARDKAISNAKEEAEKLAKSLGVKLGDIVSFQEGGNVPFYEARAFGGVMDKAESVPASPQLPVGENTYTSNVTITFEIK